MGPTDGFAAELNALKDDVQDLKRDKASNDRVQGIEYRLDRLDTRMQGFTTALLTGAIAWLVGSGMFLIAVLQLVSH